MNMELKDKIEKDLKKRNLTPKTVLDVIKYSVNGLVCYAKETDSEEERLDCFFKMFQIVRD